MEKITVTSLTKSYGKVVAVSDVSFALHDREFFSILGPSGCGKSTTLRCIAGLEDPSGGEIAIGGKVVNSDAQHVNVPTEDRPIGMVFQNYAIWPHMTVGQNVVYPLKIARRSKRTIQEKLAATLRAAGLEKLVDRYPNQLSGGEQQRVALARALIKEPEVLLLDEPLSNLDAKLREQMRFELKELQRRTGVPILYVTHDQAEALAISDRLAVMSGGRIIQMGTPAEIYSDPANEFVASFIGIMNFLPCSVVSRNGETATVEIAGGLRIPVHDRSSPLGRALLAIRPEDVSFTDSGQIPCRIEIGHFLGSVIDYRVRIGEESLRVQTAKTQHFREGEERCLRIDRAMIFPLNQTAGAKEE